MNILFDTDIVKKEKGNVDTEINDELITCIEDDESILMLIGEFIINNQ